MRPLRLVMPAALAVTTALLAVGCTPLEAAGAGSGGAATAGSTPVKMAGSVKRSAKWSAPTASVRIAPKELTGTVAPKQQVRVVKLVSKDGKPVISVTSATGPQAAQAAVAAAQQTPDVVAVAMDQRRTISDLPESNDPGRADQWALTTLAAESTWAHSRGAGVIVAVVDTGVSDQPDLAGQLLSGTDFVTGSGNGTADGEGHGTHVAGIIAAVANNHIGIAGIAPGVKILPVRVLDSTGSGSDSDVASGIVYAADHNANIINLSLGGPDQSSVLAAAVTYAQSKNVLVVAAAGNEAQSGDAPSYPAALPGVLAVAATDENNQVAYFSNTGSYVQVAAPGVDIWSTVPGGYEEMSGTSMASPYAAGVAALVKSADPALTATQVAADVTATATDLGPKGRDNSYGAGLVNPFTAVCAVSYCGATRIDFPRPASTVAAGKSMVLRAQLLDSATTHALAGRLVVWCVQPAGAAEKCTSIRTDANGRIAVSYTPYASTTVHVSFSGDAHGSGARSASWVVTLTPVVTLKVGHGTLAVSVLPPAKQPYQTQRWSGRSWLVSGWGYTDATGHVTLHVATGGTYRVLIPATAGRLAYLTGSAKIT